MKNKKSNPQQIETRYFVSLAAMDILGRGRVDFELYRPELDDPLVGQIVEASGFNFNHPNIQELIGQIKRSFTLTEVSQLIGGIGSLEIVEINIETAAYHVSDPTIPKKGEVLVSVGLSEEKFDFSTLEEYSVPFKVIGYCDRHQSIPRVKSF